jgi:hypothetical protein
MATMIPAIMHSAYARSGKTPICQMFVLGLGMDRTTCVHPAVTTLAPSHLTSSVARAHDGNLG